MAQCRSCGAEIVWAETEKGRRVPLDAKTERRAIVDELGRRAPNEPLRVKVVETYVSHFATCPHAAQHRRPRGPSVPQ